MLLKYTVSSILRDAGRPDLRILSSHIFALCFALKFFEPVTHLWFQCWILVIGDTSMVISWWMNGTEWDLLVITPVVCCGWTGDLGGSFTDTLVGVEDHGGYKKRVDKPTLKSVTIWLFNIANWKIPYKWRFLAGKIIYKWAIFHGYVKWQEGTQCGGRLSGCKMLSRKCVFACGSIGMNLYRRQAWRNLEFVFKGIETNWWYLVAATFNHYFGDVLHLQYHYASIMIRTIPFIAGLLLSIRPIITPAISRYTSI